jgi:hypothetical protein
VPLTEEEGEEEGDERFLKTNQKAFITYSDLSQSLGFR